MGMHKCKDGADRQERSKVAKILLKKSSEETQHSIVCKAAARSLGSDSGPTPRWAL